jgi:hypothetical protein
VVGPGRPAHRGRGASEGEAGTRHTVTVRLPLHPDLTAVVFVPETTLATHTARALLPERVLLRDAARNSARAALLVEAATRSPELLVPATHDWLHQEARRPSYAASMDLVDRLRADGHAATISGAGAERLGPDDDRSGRFRAFRGRRDLDPPGAGHPRRGCDGSVALTRVCGGTRAGRRPRCYIERAPHRRAEWPATARRHHPHATGLDSLGPPCARPPWGQLTGQLMLAAAPGSRQGMPTNEGKDPS